jgi:hypothetical protein
MGEVTPQPKTCATLDDVACDKLPCVDWAFGYGPAPSPNFQEIDDVALDPTDGSMVVVGQLQGTMYIGTPPLQATTPSGNLFAARIAADGTVVWASAFVPGHSPAVAVDGSGNVYVGATCQTSASIMTNGGLVALTPDAFLMQLNKSGAPQWARSLVNTPMVGHTSVISSLAVAPGGDLVVGGHFNVPVDFGDGPVSCVPSPCAIDEYTGFVAKVNHVDGKGSMATSGTYWAQLYASSSISAGAVPRVSVDGVGSVYVAGTIDGPTQIGGHSYTPSGIDLVIAAFTATGATQWWQPLGNGMTQTLDAFAVDPFGNVVITGQVQGVLGLPFSTATLSATSAQGDGFVALLTSGTGWGAWGKTFGTNGEALGVGFDAKGNVRVLGWFTGMLDLGAGPLQAGSNRMMLLAELNGLNGSAQWTRGWFYPGANTPVHLAVAPAGDSFVGGTLEAAPFDLGTGPLSRPMDTSVAWTARFAP